MRIMNVYVRFFRSFNYDYLRKSHPHGTPLPWEAWDDGGWYPFVNVDLEPGITTVVGANESGKSQLFGAVKRALTGKDVARGDFCRYSAFFAVDSSITVPEFGLRLGDLTDSDRAALDIAIGQRVSGQVSQKIGDVDAVTVVRTKDGAVTVHVEHVSEGWQAYPVADVSALNAALPTWFEIDSEVPLPASVPVAYLSTGQIAGVQTRSRRNAWLQRLLDPDDRPTAATLQILVDELAAEQATDTKTVKQLALADDLLVKVAGISRADSLS